MKINVASKICLFVLAISAVSAAVVKTQQKFNAPLVRHKRGWLGNMVKVIEKKAEEVEEKAQSFAETVSNKAKDAADDMGEHMKTAAKTVGDSMSDAAGDIGDGVKDWAQDAGKKFDHFSEDAGEKLIDVVDDVADGIEVAADRAAEVFDNLDDTLTNGTGEQAVFGNIGDTIQDTAQDVSGYVRSGAQEASNVVKDAARNFPDHLTNVAQVVSDVAEDIGDQLEDVARNVNREANRVSEIAGEKAQDLVEGVVDGMDELAEGALEMFEHFEGGVKELGNQYDEAKRMFGAIEGLSEENFDMAVAKLVHFLESEGAQLACSAVCREVVNRIVPVPIVPGLACPVLCKGALPSLEMVDEEKIRKGNNLTASKITPPYCPCFPFIHESKLNL